MGRSMEYHHPHTRQSISRDSDSDLDFELDELAEDHVASPTRPLDIGNSLPLRALRSDRLRDDAQERDTDEELQNLLAEEGSNPYGKHSSRRRSSDLENGGDRHPRRRQRKFFNIFGSHSRSTNNSFRDHAEEDPESFSNRIVAVGQRQQQAFPPNVVSNAKYTPLTFLPRTLYNEFRFFLNIYFLLVALSQIIPALRIGYLVSYIAPLAVVLSVSIGKEAWDDISRRKRDAEANSEPFRVLKFEGSGLDAGRRKGKDGVSNKDTHLGDSNAYSHGMWKVREITKPSKDITVGDVLKLGKNQRVPADVVILKSVHGDASVVKPNSPPLHVHDTNGNEGSVPPQDASELKADVDEQVPETFIRTDQLDGETDWKLRLATPLSQMLAIEEFPTLEVAAGKPSRKVGEFAGTLQLQSSANGYDSAEPSSSETLRNNSAKSSLPLTVENSAWANTVIASNATVYCLVIYTGAETRQALSTSKSRSKVGLLEFEINSLTKILCLITFSMSVILVLLGRIDSERKQPWYVSAMRFLVLFSTVIPISLRVNLDMAKLVYARYIERDRELLGTLVRTSTIPEDLGRVEYLLSDKTGTLTQNEMELKKIHIGTVSYTTDAMDEVSNYVNQAFTISANKAHPEDGLNAAVSLPNVSQASGTRTSREIGTRVRNLVLALALCHNVTPTTDVGEDGLPMTSYMASSPDEVAIVKWTENVGLQLGHRDRSSITLQAPITNRRIVTVRILNLFPFTSESKRMGIVVKFEKHSETSFFESDNNEIWFYLKGADTVMSTIVMANDWLEEETVNMAREGLRTLVIGRKRISAETYEEFSSEYSQAALALQGRDAAMKEVVAKYLERDLELLGVTGVEDKLQRDVRPSLETLRNAGVKIWMLTGDKVETAKCVAVSSKLVARGQPMLTIAKVTRKNAAMDALASLEGNLSAALLIDGESLAVMLANAPKAFIAAVAQLPTLVACRVSPTQKAELASLIKAHSGKRVACIGDGGNDVSMIQAADVGVGVVGKEGKQASLAADFSIHQFKYLTKLLLWHGRNSYKRSAKLSQFVIHRGFIVAVCQVVFSVASRFEPNALYRDWLMIGYATLYTFAPVFTLVLDRDVDEAHANLYPELYKELTRGRSLSYRSFFAWLGVSIYQGSLIQGLAQLLLPRALDDNFARMVALSYCAVVLNELAMVAVEVCTWHPVMLGALAATLAAFVASLPLLGDYMQLAFLVSVGFVWRLALALAASIVPVYLAKVFRRTYRPANYRKVQQF